jgi:hypothetical protein
VIKATCVRETRLFLCAAGHLRIRYHRATCVRETVKRNGREGKKDRVLTVGVVRKFLATQSGFLVGLMRRHVRIADRPGHIIIDIKKNPFEWDRVRC